VSDIGTVTVVDYGVGNLFSVCRALEHAGANVELATDAQAVRRAGRLVLPGVGAFADGMRELGARGLVEPIRAHAAADRPLLAICLGMQMLGTVGEEFGEHAGLGIIPGRVSAIAATDTSGTSLKVPHVAWATVHPSDGARWESSPLRGAEGRAFYFVHSFQLHPENPSDALAVCDHGGNVVTAAVARGHVLGCQFHPEKSGPDGLALLAHFLAW